MNEEQEKTIGEMLESIEDDPSKLLDLVSNLIDELNNFGEYLEFLGYREEDYLAWRDEMSRRQLH